MKTNLICKAWKCIFWTVLAGLSQNTAQADIGFEDYPSEGVYNSVPIQDGPPTVMIRRMGGGSLYVGRYGQGGPAGGRVGWFNENYPMFPGHNCPDASSGDDDMVPSSLPGGQVFDKSVLGCAFLTDNLGVSQPANLANFGLEIIYTTIPVGGASGYLLDVDGREAWTIEAFADTAMNSLLQTKRVCGDGITPTDDCDYRGSSHAVAADALPGGSSYEGVRDAVIPWSIACPNMRAIRITFSGDTTANAGMGLGFDEFDADDPLPGDVCKPVNELPPPVAKCCCGNDTIWQERGGVRQMWGISASGGFLRRQWNGNQWVSEIIAPVPNNVPLVAKSLHQNIWQWGVVAVDSQGYLHITRNVSGSWESGRPIPQIVKRLGGFDPCSVIVTDKGIWGLSKTGKLVRLYPGGGEWHFELIDTGNSEISPGSLFEGFDGSIGGLLTNGQPWGLWLNEGQWKFDWMGTDLLAPPSNCSATGAGNVLSDSVATH